MPNVPDLSAFLDDATREAVAKELRSLAEMCRSRDYNTEGIPMVLVLEDASGGTAPSGGDPVGNMLTALIGAWALEAQNIEELKPYDIATAFEVLAFRLLGSPVGSDA